MQRTLYEQLYERLKQQILSGNMASGQRLPSTCEVASEYKLSRNTVIGAYQQLEVEGYIKPIAGSGYYVEKLTSFKDESTKSYIFPLQWNNQNSPMITRLPTVTWIITVTAPKRGENVC